MSRRPRHDGPDANLMIHQPNPTVAESLCDRIPCAACAFGLQLAQASAARSAGRSPEARSCRFARFAKILRGYPIRAQSSDWVSHDTLLAKPTMEIAFHL